MKEELAELAEEVVRKRSFKEVLMETLMERIETLMELMELMVLMELMEMLKEPPCMRFKRQPTTAAERVERRRRRTC